jgi:hypothetical protein
MRRVLTTLDQRTRQFAEHALYQLLRDPAVDPQQKLAFAPALAHFVMTFADLYALVLREEPARDKYQELVNAHTYEDGGHWRWYLADLAKLGHDPRQPFSETLRFVWGDATRQTRMLSYRMCRLGLGADSLHKLVLVHCIEATGKVTLKHVAPVGKALAERTGKPLVYFGAHHLDTESDHTLEERDAQRMVEDIELGPELARELSSLVDESFALFTAGADELLAFVKGAS